MANFFSRGTFSGLGTFDFSVPDTCNASIQGTITLPTIPEGSTTNSQVVVTVSINGGGAIYTGTAGAEGFYLTHSMTAGDIFHVTLASSAVVDQATNAIRSTIIVSELS